MNVGTAQVAKAAAPSTVKTSKQCRTVEMVWQKMGKDEGVLVGGGGGQAVGRVWWWAGRGSVLLGRASVLVGREGECVILLFCIFSLLG